MKKNIMIPIVIIIILITFMPNIFAAKHYNYNGIQKDEDIMKIIEIVEQANTKIFQKIKNAKKNAELIINKYKYDEEKINQNINRIGKKLEYQTGKISERAKEKAEDMGAEVICELIEVKLENKVFLIDPLRICGF